VLIGQNQLFPCGEQELAVPVQKDLLFPMCNVGISCADYIRISGNQLLLIGQEQLLACAGQGSAVTVKYSGPAISCFSFTKISYYHVQGRDQLLQLNIQVQQLAVAQWPGSAVAQWPRSAVAQ
jgi:hypothetical protein